FLKNHLYTQILENADTGASWEDIDRIKGGWKPPDNSDGFVPCLSKLDLYQAYFQLANNESENYYIS
ncbi:unnamed protein product, partial [Amoebophrya sp. A120]